MLGLPEDYVKTVADTWQRKGIKLEPGLSKEEITAVESEYNFRFPDDLASILRRVLPVGDKFPNWRDLHSEFLQSRLAWPLEGIWFDIEYNKLWLREWGEKPKSLKDAKRIAADAVAAAPFLIPIFSHRFLPAFPCEKGNPVLSVYQTDIIYYGLDLPDYLESEFDIPNPFSRPSQVHSIKFWSDFVC